MGLKKAKISYTFYPKDWSYSDRVFELNLAERGLYRELIDLAMLNDNKVDYNLKIWARKFNSTDEEITQIIRKLLDLELIEINENQLFIPSCESRLIFVRTGSNGGSAKGTGKGSAKGMSKGLGKGSCKQKKRNIKESNSNSIPSFLEFKEYSILKIKEYKLNVSEQSLKMKYDSWVENNWMIGGKNPRKIINWKTTLINTLKFMNEDAKPKKPNITI